MLHHPMRRKKKEITDRQEMQGIIRASQVMRLALCRENEPYVVPLSFGYDGTSLFFHCASEGLKLDILRKNPRVCCLFEHGLAFEPKGDDPCAWGFAYATVIVHGEAARITDPAEKLAALQVITDQYSTSGERVPADKVGKVEVWKIGILEMTGKRAE
jgi:nitroimidazol reductase NimA-like FMN-containing flavoprotein (pyridoxamine 5'-phosphate oxidase superfamily)